MSVNNDRWISTLPITNRESGEKSKLDPDKWIETLPKAKGKNSIVKYSLTATLFIIGLILVTIVKNETRNLQKEINNLQTSINILKIDLHKAILDHEVITSPENISIMAKEYLEFDLNFYNKSQIQLLSMKSKGNVDLKEVKNKAISKKQSKKIPDEIKLIVTRKIQKKKKELKKLQEMYSRPEKVPKEIKLKVAKEIAEKKSQIKSLYDSPKDSINMKKVQKWAGIQVVKLALGIPIVPGK